MVWALLIICSICFVGIFKYIGALERIANLNKILVKVLKVIRSPCISDHWKEKILPRYALQLFSHSLLIFVILIVSFLPFIVCSILSIFFDGQFIELASSLKGIIASSSVAILSAMIISQKSEEDYGVGSKILHKMVLGNSFLGETLFDIEKIVSGPRTRDVSLEKHVFVAGLARAGTTILMRKLYENGQFCSLTYRDMPFILAPNLWRSISNLSHRKSEAKERAHGDGLNVDFDSPEALEEVFWRTFCGSDYIKKDCLVPMIVDDETIDKFRLFIGLILKNESNKCYLSKNNNNILRLHDVCKAFQNSLIVIPFRDPLQQAFSLMKQHQRFNQKDAEDQFTKKYMTWLAHHEFGADHRPFVFVEKNAGEEDTNNLCYWLRIWVDTYSYLLDKLPSQAILLSYESLCDDTEYAWGRLSEKINLVPYNETIVFSKSCKQIDDPVPQDLMLQATELYKKLVHHTI